jgi:RimJ/RimL family protein N-acetyltransferase
MLTDRHLIDIQARALFTHDSDLRMLLINEPGGGGPAPRFFLGRTREGNLWRFRADLPHDLTQELEQLCTDEPVSAALEDSPRHLKLYIELLEKHTPVNEVEIGPVYCFTEYPVTTAQVTTLTETNAEMLKNGFDDCVEELPDWQPFVALTEQGRVVSVCRSVRITPEAHEAGVETLPAFRGKGYAKEVTAEWARLVHSQGALPLYSTSWKNNASQSVAKKLNLRLFAADFHIM